MDDKTREMIAIGTSVGAHCHPCLEYHVNKAREDGLTDEEIRKGIAIGVLHGFAHHEPTIRSGSSEASRVRVSA